MSEIERRIQVLQTDISGEQDDLASIQEVTGENLPRITSGIIERIIGKWQQEAEKSLDEYKRIANLPFLQSFAHEWKDFFVDYPTDQYVIGERAKLLIADGAKVVAAQPLMINGNGQTIVSSIPGEVTVSKEMIKIIDKTSGSSLGSIFGSLTASAVLSIILAGPICAMFGAHVLYPWLVTGIVLEINFMFTLPLLGIAASKEKLNQERKKIEQLLDAKVQKLWSQPVFLISEVHSYLTEANKSYREKLIDLKGQLAKAVTAPRTELQSRLAQLETDYQSVQALDKDELLGRDEYAELINNQIEQCKKLLGHALPQEAILLEKLQQIEERLDRLESSSNGLIDLKKLYETKEELFERIKSYSNMEDQRWHALLQSKRENELQAVAVKLSVLDEEVRLTQGELGEVKTMLPEPDFYAIPSLPSVQLV